MTAPASHPVSPARRAARRALKVYNTEPPDPGVCHLCRCDPAEFPPSEPTLCVDCCDDYDTPIRETP